MALRLQAGSGDSITGRLGRCKKQYCINNRYSEDARRMGKLAYPQEQQLTQILMI